VSRRHFMGKPALSREPRGVAPAGAAARARRREIAGRVPHQRKPARSRAAHRPPPSDQAAFDAFEFARRMAKIIDVRGRRVWDSRGRATVEAEVTVGRGATPLARGRAIAPAGASTGSGEAKSI